MKYIKILIITLLPIINYAQYLDSLESSSQDQNIGSEKRPELMNDALPNPFSEEGIELLREHSQSKIIPVNSIIESEIAQTFSSFLESISLNNQSLFNEIVQIESTKRELLFNSLRDDFEKREINISDFGIGVTQINNNYLNTIMLDKNGIESAKITFQKVNENWLIVDIKP